MTRGERRENFSAKSDRYKLPLSAQTPSRGRPPGSRHFAVSPWSHFVRRKARFGSKLRASEMERARPPLTILSYIRMNIIIILVLSITLYHYHYLLMQKNRNGCISVYRSARDFDHFSSFFFFFYFVLLLFFVFHFFFVHSERGRQNGVGNVRVEFCHKDIIAFGERTSVAFPKSCA